MVTFSAVEVAKSIAEAADTDTETLFASSGPFSWGAAQSV